MESIHEHLAAITAGSTDRDVQVICVRPYRLDVEGVTWTIATDGHVLAAVKGAHAEPLDHHQAAAPAPLLRAALALICEPIDLAALRAFVGPYEPCIVTPCALCGLPERPIEDWERGDENCPACQGWGRSTPFRRPVRVRGQVLDANLLGRAIRCLDGDTVAGWSEPGTKYAMFVLRGPSSFACVMSMPTDRHEGEFIEPVNEAAHA
jgi:hypothetical protein